MTTLRRTARRPTVARGTAPRRGTAWDDKLVNFSLANGAGTAAIELVTNVSDTEKRGCTLVRLLLDLSFWANPPGTVSGVQLFDTGIGLVSDDARLAAELL